MLLFYRKILLVAIFLLSANLWAVAQQDALPPGEHPVITSELADTNNVLITIGDITIRGYKKTKVYVIEREVPFTQGDYLLKNELKEKLELCRQQLMNTSLFVDVEVTARREEEVAHIDVYVKERWYLFPLPYFKIVGRNFNDWWVEHKRSLQRVNYGLKFMQHNVSGRADNLNIWLISGYTQQVTLRYENPFADKTLRHGLSVGVSYHRNREVHYADSVNKQVFVKNPDEFLSRSWQLDLGYSYRPAIKTRHHFRMQYTDVEMDRHVLERNPEYHPNGQTRIRYPAVSYTLQHFNVDYIPYPLKGFMGEVNLFTRISNDFLSQLSVRATYTKELFPKSYVQFQGAGMLKLPFQQSFYSLSMFGGSDFYMRGLEPFVIQGVAGGFGRATAIKQVLSFSVKNPINIASHDKIPFRFMLKAYGDVGYAYLQNPRSSLLNNKLLRTWGAGIDVITIYDAVLKVEYSFNQLGQQGLFIHTTTDF